MTDHRDIRDALDLVVPHYQPIVDLNTGEVIGAETLVRCTTPEGEIRLPAGLIEQIEESPSELEVLMAAIFWSIASDIRPVFDHCPRFYISSKGCEYHDRFYLRTL